MNQTISRQTSEHMTALTDASLGQQAAAGEHRAFEEIVRRYSRPLAEFAAGKSVSWQDAEDIVQETFMRAFVNIRTFNPQCSLKNWLYTIAYRLMVSSWRKKRTVRLSDEAADLLPERTSPVDDDPDGLWDTARKIGPDAYTALWLRYRQDMNVEEIASVMQKTNIGVRVLLHRSRRQLARALQTSSGEQTPLYTVYSERTS